MCWPPHSPPRCWVRSGASVTKVEDPDRLDIYRRRGPYIDGVAGPDYSAYFAAMNHSKKSMVIPMSRDAEPLARLVAESDVVLENFGQRRARRLGVDAATLLRNRPDMLAVSSSGFGYEGPWSAYRAYAYNLHTAGGLAYLTRGSDGRAADLDLPWADLISGSRTCDGHRGVGGWPELPLRRSRRLLDAGSRRFALQRVLWPRHTPASRVPDRRTHRTTLFLHAARRLRDSG